VLGILAVPGTVAVANAQDDDGAKKSPGSEEIIVTSRKREKSVFDIPVAVTTFSADDMQNMGLEELPDLVAHTPGFHYAENSVGRGDYLYQGETWQTNANVSKTGAWGTVNLRVGIMTDGWRAEAYGSNIFDEKGYSAFQNFPDLSFQTGGRQVSGRFFLQATTISTMLSILV